MIDSITTIIWGEDKYVAKYDFGGISFTSNDGLCEYVYLISIYSGYPYVIKKIKENLKSNDNILTIPHLQIVFKSNEQKNEFMAIVEGWLEYFETYIKCFKESCKNETVDQVEIFNRLSIYNTSYRI